MDIRIPVYYLICKWGYKKNHWKLYHETIKLELIYTTLKTCCICHININFPKQKTEALDKWTFYKTYQSRKQRLKTSGPSTKLTRAENRGSRRVDPLQINSSLLSARKNIFTKLASTSFTLAVHLFQNKCQGVTWFHHM